MRKGVDDYAYDKAEEIVKEKFDGIYCYWCGGKLTEDTPDYRYGFCSIGCYLNWLKTIPVTSNAYKKIVLKRDKYTCARCGKKYPENRLTADHIKPIAIGGEEFDLDNIQTLCSSCNKIKSQKDQKIIDDFLKSKQHHSKC